MTITMSDDIIRLLCFPLAVTTTATKATAPLLLRLWLSQPLSEISEKFAHNFWVIPTERQQIWKPQNTLATTSSKVQKYHKQFKTYTV